ncbi:alpha/beta hydrolase [Nocardioides montaniterrae]
MTRETDILGEPWQAETIRLADDFEGEVVATLVSRPTEEPTERAVLHIHGFSDYFFQTEYAEWWLDRGHDFYALDLRKYGRSLRPHQSGTYVDDLTAYFEELDAAWERITQRDGHTRVVVVAHSTGGLVAPLWLDARQPDALEGLVLNSPWLDLQGKPIMRSPLVNLGVTQIGRFRPMQVLGREVEGFYGKGLHKDHGGEWEFNLDWKPLSSFPVRFGWLAAIRAGHAKVQAGLDVPGPVLVLSSDRSGAPTSADDVKVSTTDIVLDVRQIRRWATAIGKHVTYAAVPGAIHDVFISRRPARDRAFDETARWLGAYVD